MNETNNDVDTITESKKTEKTPEEIQLEELNHQIWELSGALAYEHDCDPDTKIKTMVPLRKKYNQLKEQRDELIMLISNIVVSK